MRRLKLLSFTLFLSLISVFGGLTTAGAMNLPHYTFADASQTAACDGLAQVNSSQGCGSSGGDNAVGNLTSSVVNILSIVIGAAAIIMIILSGFWYITSGGDSNKVGSAKNSLIYALVGIAIASLAQFLVHFVLHNTKSG